MKSRKKLIILIGIVLMIVLVALIVALILWSQRDILIVNREELADILHLDMTDAEIIDVQCEYSKDTRLNWDFTLFVISLRESNDMWQKKLYSESEVQDNESWQTKKMLDATGLDMSEIGHMGHFSQYVSFDKRKRPVKGFLGYSWYRLLDAPEGSPNVIMVIYDYPQKVIVR